MADKSKWHQVSAFNQRARDNVIQKCAIMRQMLTGAFADPEAYGKIVTNNDQGILGINTAVRKHRDAQEEFSRLFINRAKQYSDCKNEIKRKGTMIKEEFQKAENLVESYGLKYHNR